MITFAASMLARGEPLTREGIREELHGNLCRCTGYQQIVDAIEAAQRSGDAVTASVGGEGAT
jgi:carbon-monoxide dehydrogenase small subunit